MQMNSRQRNLMEKMDLIPLISVIYKNEQRYLEHKIKELDINSTQVSCLMEIYSHGDVEDQHKLCQKDLVEILNFSKSTISTSLSKLEEFGYINRKIDPNNRRKNMIYLTKKGCSVIPKIIEIDKMWEHDIDCKLITEELKAYLIKIAIQSWKIRKSIK